VSPVLPFNPSIFEERHPSRSIGVRQVSPNLCL
jgi:hypothetical protein